MSYSHAIRLKRNLAIPENFDRLEIWLAEQNIEYRIETLCVVDYSGYVLNCLMNEEDDCSIYYVGFDDNDRCFGYMQICFNDIADATMFKLR